MRRVLLAYLSSVLPALLAAAMVPRAVAEEAQPAKPSAKPVATPEQPKVPPEVEKPGAKEPPPGPAGMPLPRFPGEGLMNGQPPFLVGVRLFADDLTYREGEILRARFTAEKDAHLYLIYHQADGRSVLLFPNEARPNNRVPAKQDVLVPDFADPFRFRIGPPFGTEVFQVLATLKPLEELDGLVKKTGRAPAVPRELFDKLRGRLAKDLSSWAEHRVPVRTVAKTAVPPPRSANRVGLFIGVSKSQKDRKTTDRFSRGAELLAKTMTERGGLHPQGVKVLTGEEATRASIESAALKWLPSVSEPGDTVFIFYAGHGLTIKSLDSAKPDGRDGLLSTYDDDLGPDVRTREEAEARARGKFISDDALARWLQELPGRQIVVMLETCHAGAVIDTRVLARYFAQHAARVKGISQLDVVVLAACSPEESGYSDPGQPVWMAYYLAEAMTKFPQPVTLRQGYEHYVQGQKRFLKELSEKAKVQILGLQEPVLTDSALLPIVLAP